MRNRNQKAKLTLLISVWKEVRKDKENLFYYSFSTAQFIQMHK